MNPFEGLTESQARILTLEAMSLHDRARANVMEYLVEQIFDRLGASKIGELPIREYIRAEAKKQLPTLLATMSDHDPDRTTQLVKVLEAIERGHI